MAESYQHKKLNGVSFEQSKSDMLTASTTPPPGGIPIRSNALSSKLTSILSASYADLEIRDALDTLDERKIETTPETRRQFRLDVQKEVINCNADIIGEFGAVAEQLKRIGSTIATLNLCCNEIRKQIEAARTETAPILKEASKLMTEKQGTETKQQLLEAFRAHFVVSREDTDCLTSSAEPVSDRFFVIMARVKSIYRDCQVLLGTENQTMGLEIMEKSSKNLNGAFQKLYRWTQHEFKTLDLENPQINSQIRHALRVLAERPTLFQSCLDFFAEAREHILSDAFHMALTGSSSDPDEHLPSKPIELFAHDPLRYVGDMLAWTHSATVSEREALESLFISEGGEMAKGIQTGLANEPWSREELEDSEVFDGRKALNQLVNRDLEGVARILRQRVDQVIHGYEEPVLAYKISNLINFYCITFERLLGAHSSVLGILAALEDSALRQFRATMKDHIAAVQGDLPRAPPSLEPPEFLDEALEQLKALMQSFETSLAPASSKEADFQPVLEEALDPFLVGCEKLSRNLEEPASDIFVINCLLAIKRFLKPFSFVKGKVSKVDEIVGQRADKLVEHQHAWFLHTSGLYSLVAALSQLSESLEDLEKIKSLPPFGPKALAASSQKLDDFLPSALMDAKEKVAQLQSQQIAQEVTEAAASRFCEDFDFIEGRMEAADELMEGRNEEAEQQRLRVLFPRTSGDIRVLLS
ncbi:MAG: Golgi transport complex subunit 6 [Vezdaea acicularis]|nr:MAG: Golgi transport complex subunit 6 [Vezdaea acicularis]